MISTTHYNPEQPFFELSTERHVSRVGAHSMGMALYYSFVVSPGRDQAIVAVPDATIDILFQCSGSRPKAQVCGSVKKGKQVEFKGNELYFGVRFFPGTADALLQCPLNQFTAKEIPLADVRDGTEELVERISTAETFNKRIQVFDRFYKECTQRKANRPALISHLLNTINSSQGDIRVGELAASTGYSARHISGLFTRTIGISPKFYARIVRFQRCLGMLFSEHPASYAGLAQEHGYYDQAHLINEFREFSLCTPNQALAGRS